MTTAPRLCVLLPEVTVQRARWSASSWCIGLPPGSDRGEVAFVPASELGAGLPDRVFEAVGEGDRRGGDDVRVRAHGGPFARAVGGFDRHPRPRASGRVRIEDPDLVVVEVDGVEDRVERTKRLAQRGVERVDRAVAVGGGVERLPVHLDLHGRLCPELLAMALLDETRVVDDPEWRSVARRLATNEELKGSLGTFEGEAFVLEALDEHGQLLRVDALEAMAQLRRADRGVGLPAQLGDHQSAPVADPGRGDVLV